MLINYLKVAWRNIIKSQFYTVVNIIGLSTGIAFTLLIAAYVWNEFQVNQDLRNADRQYIIQSKWKDPNMGYDLTTLGPLSKALHVQYPDLVANYFRWDGITSTVSKGDKHFREGLQICDSTLLSMYGFGLLHGNASTAFNNPFSAIITEDKARKYFGKTDVIGQAITIESQIGTKHDFTVSAILKEAPKNSVTYINADNDNQIFVPANYAGFFGRNLDIWNNRYIVGFIELQKGVTPDDLEKPVHQLIELNTPKDVVDNLEPFFVPLKKYYLDGNNGIIKKTLYTLSGIAVFILLMAVINFINMSISRSATRMKEIGIRKSLGGLRKQLITQFLTESVMLVLIATIFAVFIYALSRNYFSGILGEKIPDLAVFPVYFMFILLLFAFLVGILAGIYPAFVLSSQKSIDALKGKLKSVKGNTFFRKSLVVFQFCIATVAFVGAIIISQQINLFFSKNLGFDKEYILSAQVPRNWSVQGVKNMEAIRNEFAAMPQISSTALSYEIPDGNNGDQAPVYNSGSDSSSAIFMQALKTDENYAVTYRIPLIAGDYFQGHGLDSGKVVMNEKAVRALGYKNVKEAIGKQIKIFSGGGIFTIKGVTNDFHFGSMQFNIQPIVFFNVEFWPEYRFLSFKIKPGNISSSIAAIQKKWSRLMPGAAFEYGFMDDALAKIYTAEIQLKKASYTATVLALIIVLLGVIGFISLSIQRRTKEIGIRKVLGSSVSGIVALFTKEFLLIIVMAGAFAGPLAFLVMQHWLNGYAYRIIITAQPFLISIFALIFITSALIFFQTIKAANANPVKSLRTE